MKHVKTTATFKSQQANKTWMTFHNTYYKTEYAIYLMERTVCNLQYVGKNKIPFNTGLNNDRYDIKDVIAILADKDY